MSDQPPEADRVEGVPHPRETMDLFGQSQAEAEVLGAMRTGRLHHAWLLAGPRGIGKATLAWRMARSILSRPPPGASLFGEPEPPTTLQVPADHPDNRRLLALAHPRLFLLRRPWDEEKARLKAQITVDEVRRMKGFFALSAADGGARVAIIDDADAMNISAANALLKLLEEPPDGAVLILISHQPSRLMATIRSRCRMLRLSTLGPDDLALALASAGLDPAPGEAQGLAELAGGSVGDAVRLSQGEGLALYRQIIGVLSSLPRLHRQHAVQLADSAATKGAEGRFELILTLLDLFLARVARAGITGETRPEAAPGEAALIRRLSPDAGAARQWADCAQSLGVRARRGRAVNLDPSALLLDMLLKIDETAGTLAHR